VNSELLSLMSLLNMAGDDEQEGEEETEWYNHDGLDYEQFSDFGGEDSEETDSDLQGECAL
jgi:hypothetical protein